MTTHVLLWFEGAQLSNKFIPPASSSFFTSACRHKLWLDLLSIYETVVQAWITLPRTHARLMLRVRAQAVVSGSMH